METVVVSHRRWLIVSLKRPHYTNHEIFKKNIRFSNKILIHSFQFSRGNSLEIIIFSMINFQWVTNDECSKWLQWTIAKEGPTITWCNRHINSAIWFIDRQSDQSNRRIGKMYWRHKELQLGKNCQNLSRFWLGSKLGQKIRSPRIVFLYFSVFEKVKKSESDEQPDREWTWKYRRSWTVKRSWVGNTLGDKFRITNFS